MALLNQRMASDGSGGAGGTRILLGGSTVHNSERYVLLGCIYHLRLSGDSQLPEYGRGVRRKWRPQDIQPPKWSSAHIGVDIHEPLDTSVAGRWVIQHDAFAQLASRRVRAIRRWIRRIGPLPDQSRGGGKCATRRTSGTSCRGHPGWSR